MEFFDNLSELLSEKGKEAAQTAKRVAEIANLKGQISGIKTEIKKNYRKIGEAYYEAYKSAEVGCEFEEYVQAIRDAERTLEELNHKVGELKGESKCKNCGSFLKADSIFCSKCGAKVEEEFFDEEDAEEDFFDDDTAEEKDAEDFFDDEDAEEDDQALFVDDEVEELEEVEE